MTEKTSDVYYRLAREQRELGLRYAETVQHGTEPVRDRANSEDLMKAGAAFARAEQYEQIAYVSWKFENEGGFEYEYGVEYEISGTDSVFTLAHSRAQAERWVAESPRIQDYADASLQESGKSSNEPEASTD